MKLLEKVQSEVDNVVKYTFKRSSYFDEERPVIFEFSYIDNGTGKDIICVSTQSMCAMGCSFCHCTDHLGKIPVKDATAEDIFRGVKYIIDDLEEIKDVLLISFMGCGEPFNLLNGNALLQAMKWIINAYEEKYNTVRFAVSTCLPRRGLDKFLKFVQYVKDNKLPVKLHLSLHYTKDGVRKQWMPNSLDIKTSIAVCNFYRQYTGNSVEIHYTLIQGVNDRNQDRDRLVRLLYGTDFDIKLITYNEKDTLPYKKTEHPKVWSYWLINGLGPGYCGKVEIYTPPGRDIGSSCGQFLFETHEKWIKKWEEEKRSPNVQIIY